MDVIYRYDGTLEGFLCCVFESYVNKEPPMGFQGPEDLEPTLFPVRWVETDSAHARRIRDSIRRRSAWAGELVEKGFLTCEKEGRSNYYRARISEEDYKAAEGRTFLEKLYGNSFTGMVASLYDSRAIGPEDLNDLRRFLDELEGK